MKSFSAKLFTRKGNPVGRLTFFGRSKKQAQSRAKHYARAHNIAEGFYDPSGVFHPIRAAADYSERKAISGARTRARGRVRAIVKSRLKKRNPAKRKAKAKKGPKRNRLGRFV